MAKEKIPYYCVDDILVVCCRYVVCGKGIGDVQKKMVDTAQQTEISQLYLFPKYRQSLKLVQLTTSENIGARGEITHKFGQ